MAPEKYFDEVPIELAHDEKALSLDVVHVPANVWGLNRVPWRAASPFPGFTRHAVICGIPYGPNESAATALGFALETSRQLRTNGGDVGQ